MSRSPNPKETTSLATKYDVSVKTIAEMTKAYWFTRITRGAEVAGATLEDYLDRMLLPITRPEVDH